MSQTARDGTADAKSVTRRPRVTLIAAVSANGVIGAGGRMPWHLPSDLKFFRAQTMGRPVVMGRRTWESIGRPLPGRENVVVSRSPAFRPAGAIVVPSLEAAIAHCSGADEVFVIGGGELYRAALQVAGRIVLTEIHRAFEGDVRFPEFDRAQWIEARRERHAPEGELAYDFVWYERAAT